MRFHKEPRQNRRGHGFLPPKPAMTMMVLLMMATMIVTMMKNREKEMYLFFALCGCSTPRSSNLLRYWKKNCYLIFLFSFWYLFFLFTWMLKSSAFFLWPSFTAQWNFFKMSFTEYNWKVKVKVRNVKSESERGRIFLLKMPSLQSPWIFSKYPE